MTMEQKLMRNLMKAGAATRRRPPKEQSNKNHKEHGEHTAHRHKTRSSAHILGLLSVNEGLTQNQIAEQLGIRAQSVSEAISKLEGRGLVCKKTSEEDKRKSLIYLTEEGHTQRESIAKEREDHEKRFFAVLTDEEKGELLRLLEKLNSAFAEDKEAE